MARTKHSFGFKSSKLFFSELIVDFGIKYFLMATSFYGGIHGCFKQFATSIELPFYDQGKWDSSRYQSNMAISNTPMTLKSICGILSDVLPFAGYEKGSWFFIYTILGAGSCAIFGLIPMSAETTSHWIPPMLFFFMQMQVAFGELLLQSKYVELIGKNKNNRGNIISYAYLCTTIGQIPPHFFIGTLVELLDIRNLFLIFLPIAIQPLVFLFAGCIVNDRASPDRNNKIDFSKLKAQSKIISLAFIVFFCCFGTLFFALFANQALQFGYALGVAVVTTIATFLLLPSIVAKINAYIYLSEAFYINIQGAMEYFYIADEECVPGGPHFSMLYYRTVVGVMSIIAQLIGLALFQSYLSHMKYHVTFVFTTCVRIFAAFFDFIIVLRLNIKIGLSDELTYLFGNAIINEMSVMLDRLPALVLMAKLCPKQIESTLFAILLSFGNFGQNLARYAGGYLLDIFNISLQSGSTECRIDNLEWLIIFSHVLMPLISMILIFLLLPPIYIKDDIVDSVYATSIEKFKDPDYKDAKHIVIDKY